MKVTFKCEQCGKEKSVYPSRIQYAKYCSRSCRSKSNVHKMLPFRHTFSKGWQPPTRLGRNASNYRHGLCDKRIYSSWSNMVSRCTNSKRKDYHRYGGRGIKVCEGLYASATGLYKLLGDPPPKLSLNRIDNDANYSCGSCLECLANKWPMNVGWATQREQCLNTCRNKPK